MGNLPLKVLFVDDDAILGGMFVTAFKGGKYDVHYQNSLVAIESIIAELNPNIIILDVHIGSENGIDKAKIIRGIYPDIPIVFMSSSSDLGTMERAIIEGGYAFIKKPFRKRELEIYIDRYANVTRNIDIRFGHFLLDVSSHTLINDNSGNTKCLSATEYALLKILAANLDYIVDRKVILQEIWNNKEGCSQSLNNYISKLRHHLVSDDSVQLETVAGVGYKLHCYPVLPENEILGAK